MRALAFAASLLLFATSSTSPLASGAEPELGLVKERPAEGFFVETEQGFMIPYEATIPGTDVKYRMTPIPGGRFKLGSPADEQGREELEGPQVEVVVEPCWVGVYEITWSEYHSFMAMCDIFIGLRKQKTRPIDDDNRVDAVTAPSNLYDPSFAYHSGSGPRQPAVTMSQFAAKQYTKWLSLLTGRFYRLPTEAEWEYACRAGTTSAYSFGDDAARLGDYAWYYENSDDKSHDVGLKKPNPWGLYDMHGNAGEWVLDAFSEDGYKKLAGKTTKAADAIAWPTELYPRVVRGGTWDFDAEMCRSASRLPSHDDKWRERDPNFPQSPWWLTDGDALGIGFRMVRPFTPPADRKDREKYWDADLEQILRDAAHRIEVEGKGARGIVDRDLPEAIKRLEKKQ